eukprot:352294_1
METTNKPQENTSSRWPAFFKWFCLFTIVVTICAFSIYGADVLFNEAKDIKAYIKGFTLEGQCILISRDSTVGEVRVIVEYKWNIYNHSACIGKQFNIKSKDEVSFDVPDDEIYKYDIGDIETCYSNEQCDDVVMNPEDAEDKLTSGIQQKNVGGGFIIFFAVCIFCVASYFCGYPAFAIFFNLHPK